jgi:hemolysin activation/secretion protein
LNAPILRSRTQALAASVSAEHLRQIAHSTLFGRDTSRDEYAVLRGSLDWSASTTSGAGVSTSLTAARGLGGRDRDDGRRTAIPLSRLGADPEFTKAGFTAQAVQPLPYGGLHASVTVAGQTSFNAPLLRSEQLALDGSSLVSGIASGTLSVDRGLAGRAELARPIAVATGAGQAMVTPYLFMALGLGYLELPTALEAARVSGRSLGGGVRFDVAESGKMPGLNVALEIAHHASYIATTKRGSRVSLSVASRF